MVEVVVATLERGRGGRRLGDADRGEPPAELVGIGHDGRGIRVGKDGRGQRMDAKPYPARCRPCQGRGGEDGGRGLQACRGGEAAETADCRLQTGPVSTLKSVWSGGGGRRDQNNKPAEKIGLFTFIILSGKKTNKQGVTGVPSKDKNYNCPRRPAGRIICNYIFQK